MRKDTTIEGIAWLAVAAVAILAYHILPTLLFPGN
jgi:hypothetical protein